MTALKPSWRDVFDTDKNHYGHIRIAWEMARKIKYPFMTWNGHVWMVTETGAERTGIAVKELGGGSLDSREDPICLCPAATEYDTPCPRHGVLGIGVTGAS